MKPPEPPHLHKPQPLDEPLVAVRKPTLQVEITPLSMVVALLLAGMVWMLARLAPVILVLVTALMIVATLYPMISWLERHGLRRGMAIAIVFASLLLLLAALLTVTLPALAKQVASLLSQEPELREKLAAFLARYRYAEPLAEGLRTLQYGPLLKASRAEMLAFSKNVLEVVAYGVAAVFLALYIAIDGERLRGALFAVVPRTQHIPLSRILLNLQTIVGGYLRGQAITSLCMGVFIFVLLTLCGVPNALAIAAFGAVADVLPFINFFLTIIPTTLAALAQSQTTAVIVFVLMFAYEEFESRLLIPLVYGRALRMPSSVVFFALLAGGTLYGVVGALLALPVAATLFMLIEELRIELPGDGLDTEREEQKEEDERTAQEYARRAEGLPADKAAALAVKIAEKNEE
ncbi:AI-2E family transporter|uniref:AI-2E family transporter n=1 Tax=Noviherbaspirillum sp. L7-7A TaxID=2850560 RepID=UPI001C2C707A|nr:AI-2E family transporter [Noviherbaspirillum sp. L7-7A]MBV0879965.1 AI-2E family transporter [Noviherbaspirillum sp. L7-7A]